MLQLELDVSQPWLRTAGVAQDVLLVNSVFVALRCIVSYAGWGLTRVAYWRQHTTRWRSGCRAAGVEPLGTPFGAILDEGKERGLAPEMAGVGLPQGERTRSGEDGSAGEGKGDWGGDGERGKEWEGEKRKKEEDGAVSSLQTILGEAVAGRDGAGRGSGSGASGISNPSVGRSLLELRTAPDPNPRFFFICGLATGSFKANVRAPPRWPACPHPPRFPQVA